MKILFLLTALLFAYGCPDDEGDEQEVETRITRDQFLNDLGQLEIGYDSNVRSASFQCRIRLTGGANERNDDTWRACDNPHRIAMQMNERLELQVRAVTADGRVDITPEVFTYVRGPNNTPPVSANLLQPPVFQVGIAHEFRVPEGMHITQYATNNNYQGAGIELVRLQQGQGYNYLGSYPLQALGGNGCSTYAQGIVGLKSPSGRAYNYCRSFLDVGTFMGMFARNYARNHIEVASDDHFNGVQTSGRPYARLLVQTYGPQEKAMISNRFNDLCHPSRIIKPISSFRGIPMAQGFWLAQEMRVRDTYTCTVKMGGLSGGFYQVGGFTVVTRVNGSHQPINFAKYLSVVYMERISGDNGVDPNFARNFQHTLINSLSRNRP